MITPEWLAGFFDGEGCVRLKRERRWGGRDAFSPALELSQKDKRVMEDVQGSFKGRLYHSVGRCWALCWSGKEAVELAQILLPYSKCKRSQLALLLEAMEVPSRHRGAFFGALKAEKRNVQVA